MLNVDDFGIGSDVLLWLGRCDALGPDQDPDDVSVDHLLALA